MKSRLRQLAEENPILEAVADPNVQNARFTKKRQDALLWGEPITGDSVKLANGGWADRVDRAAGNVYDVYKKSKKYLGAGLRAAFPAMIGYGGVNAYQQGGMEGIKDYAGEVLSPDVAAMMLPRVGGPASLSLYSSELNANEGSDWADVRPGDIEITPTRVGGRDLDVPDVRTQAPGMEAARETPSAFETIGQGIKSALTTGVRDSAANQWLKSIDAPTIGSITGLRPKKKKQQGPTMTAGIRGAQGGMVMQDRIEPDPVPDDNVFARFVMTGKMGE